MRRFRGTSAVKCLLVLVCLAAAFAQSKAKQYVFHGKVQSVDAKAGTVKVDGENVEGWMPAMVMDYKVDNADVLKKLQAGDRITAKVYDGDMMTLHSVAKSSPATAPKK